MRYLWIALLLVGLCSAQATFTSTTDIRNHGGFGLSTNLGANQGDAVVLVIYCDHDIHGYCFAGPPLLTGSPFTLAPKDNHYHHQVWRATVLSTGDQVVTAAYPWIGPLVNYHVHIIAYEPLD
jgi:hypothetical protein